jgi:hypothetical protein
MPCTLWMQMASRGKGSEGCMSSVIFSTVVRGCCSEGESKLIKSTNQRLYEEQGRRGERVRAPRLLVSVCRSVGSRPLDSSSRHEMETLRRSSKPVSLCWQTAQFVQK